MLWKLRGRVNNGNEADECATGFWLFLRNKTLWTASVIQGFDACLSYYGNSDGDSDLMATRSSD
jgi:hypothetical protein